MWTSRDSLNTENLCLEPPPVLVYTRVTYMSGLRQRRDRHEIAKRSSSAPFTLHRNIGVGTLRMGTRFILLTITRFCILGAHAKEGKRTHCRLQLFAIHKRTDPKHDAADPHNMIVESQSYATTTAQPRQIITCASQLREYLEAVISSTHQDPTS